jgi:hypothetical protein
MEAERRQKLRRASLISASETDYPDSGPLPPGLHSTTQRLLIIPRAVSWQTTKLRWVFVGQIAIYKISFQ